MNKANQVLLVLVAAFVAFCFTQIAFADDGNASAQGNLNIQPSGDGQVAKTPADYLIAEEDVLRMDVWGEQQLSNLEMQVTPDGKINVPYIGEMQAKGLTQAILTKNIAEAFVALEILVNPRVQISLVNMHKPTVRVWGAVNRPGEIEFKEGDKVMDAVAGAGSYIIDNAWLEKATLTRNGQSFPVDLKKMLDRGDFTDNLELQKGDTIYIPTEDYQNKFYVLGQVMRPGIYDLKDETTVLAAISLAGGATDRGKLRSTVIVRGDPKKPERVECNLTRLFDKGDLTQDIALRPGDVVVVPETKTPDLSKIASFISTLVNFSYLRRNGF